MSVLGPEKEKRRTITLSVTLFLWLVYPPVSALCLLHLITSQCLTTVREKSHEAHHSLICLTDFVYEVCLHVWSEERIEIRRYV